MVQAFKALKRKRTEVQEMLHRKKKKGKCGRLDKKKQTMNVTVKGKSTSVIQNKSYRIVGKRNKQQL